MKTINEIINELVAIGRSYPKTQSFWERLLTPHTHQASAQELINLSDIKAEGLSKQNKIKEIKSVVCKIYHTIEKPGKLLTDIDQCLRQGDDFQSYVQKCADIQKEIDDSDKEKMNSDSYGLQITFNIKNYRDAVESINFDTLQFDNMRNTSVGSSFRSTSIFSIEKSIPDLNPCNYSVRF